MKESRIKKDLVDLNDIIHVNRLGFFPLRGRPAPRDLKTGKINPHVTQFGRNDGLIVSVFHVKPIYYESIYKKWRPLTEVASWVGNHKIIFNENWVNIHPRYLRWLQKRMDLIGGSLFFPTPFNDFKNISLYAHELWKTPRVGLTTTTVYPDPNVETTTVDGYVGGGDATWATVHDMATAEDVSDLSTSAPNISDNAGEYRIYRTITLFDTSVIGSGQSVSAATYSLYAHGVSGTPDDTAQSFYMVQSAPASNTALVAGDMDGFTVHSDTSGGSRSVADFSIGSYLDFTVNATGLTWISVTGVTKLGCRRSVDADETAGHGSAPTGVTQSHRDFRMADTADVTSDPKLVVTHAGASVATPMGNLPLLGVG